MSKWSVVAIAAVMACKGKDKPKSEPAPKPEPVASVDAAPALDPSETGPVTPKSKRGFVVFSTKVVLDNHPMRNEALQIIDPDGGKPIETPVHEADMIVVGPHLIAGRLARHWLLDLRAPRLVAKEQEHALEYVTPDDRVVWAGGGGKTFQIFISDADGKTKKTLLDEPDDDVNNGVIGAVGRDLVHANYSVVGTKPWFSVAITDGKRTDYPDLLRRAKSDKDVTYEPFYSPNGTKAVSVADDLLVTTFDGSVKPQTFVIPGGKPARAECRFSADDTLMACSLLLATNKTGIDELYLYDLKTNKASLLANEVAIAEFQWAPDGKEIAYVAFVDGKKWVLRVTSVDGKSKRDLFSIDAKDRMLDVHGWTAPN